ncbi:Levodione reductase [Colletotrichum tanaceti]|uniref:Levodione reductase n=1 Tax=Colletotrichum tanaceti TaxID=1306861 RepID=A0A4U6XGY6_9PEZI|nr:Levodione reductase [Colletotrichum tanaceti]KAJ0167263.1 Levodione reductase [Colletotrichum tanaceti]TKW55055.1 Levodione reductase [Colletotrichum tanaceti]
MSATLQFRDKVIAVTGAASGIGLATAHLLASRGARLSLADINEQGLRDVQSDIRTRHAEAEIVISAVDVTNYDQVEKWTASTVEHFGRLDGAANLAGVIPKSAGTKGLADQDLDEWEFVMGVNLTGVMHCLKAQLSVMRDDGSIVNASSIAGLQGRPNNGAYTASKHAILGLTRTAAKEPVLNVYREMWHCNSTGVYSGIVESNIDNIWPRGIQPTDEDGDSIIPGHYTSRATHIHLMVHANATLTLYANSTLGNVISSSHVGQTFFDQDLISAEVTTNADDSILGEEAMAFGINTTMSNSASGGGAGGDGGAPPIGTAPGGCPPPGAFSSGAAASRVSSTEAASSCQAPLSLT